VSDHVVSPKVYLAVFAALLLLTYLTVAAAGVDLGEPAVLGVRVPLNAIVALAIAVTKASLVVLFFMHIRWGTRLNWLVIASGVVWFGILISLTLTDYLSRGWLGTPGS
jgi:cytochrome c oxidase subunit IV